ncbi:hypothetical protein GCM10017708_09710 [Arthrobacter citreus]
MVHLRRLRDPCAGRASLGGAPGYQDIEIESTDQCEAVEIVTPQPGIQDGTSKLGRPYIASWL